MYVLQTRKHQEDSLDAVIGMLRVFYLDVYDLLDPTATLSYLTSYIAVKFYISPETLSEPFLVCSPIGDPVMARPIYKNYPVAVSLKVT